MRLSEVVLGSHCKYTSAQVTRERAPSSGWAANKTKQKENTTGSDTTYPSDSTRRMEPPQRGGTSDMSAPLTHPNQTTERNGKTPEEGEQERKPWLLHSLMDGGWCADDDAVL